MPRRSIRRPIPLPSRSPALGNSSPDVTLTVGRTTTDVPDAPLSVFGSLALAAPIVEQGGIVRAPFGTISLGQYSVGFLDRTSHQVDLLPGSLTSVSMAGMVIPYGGTVDGVTYSYNGAAVTTNTRPLTNFNNSGVASGIVLDSQSVNVAGGATLDLSGGGALSGAGFISGRGGSVNVLTTPLVNANPATPVSKSGDKVYAIVPGYASGYAPIAPENGAGDPVIGQQITIPAGVPGLPAGTYTLLPSNYALLPGAYRVELAGSSPRPIGGPVAIGNGTYATQVGTGIASTTIHSSLPVTALITSGTSVRSYSQYNEQSYGGFFLANAAQFGGVRSLLPADGKALEVKFEMPSQATGSALTFDGTTLFQAAPGGGAGQVLLMNVGEIYSDPSTATFPGVSIDASSINALKAPRLMVNGFDTFNNGAITFQGGSNIAIRDGVTLSAGEIFLIGGNISIGNDVTLTTIGRGSGALRLRFDRNGLQHVLRNLGSGAVQRQSRLSRFAGHRLDHCRRQLATLLRRHTGVATNGASSIDPTAHFGSRNIALRPSARSISVIPPSSPRRARRRACCSTRLSSTRFSMAIRCMAHRPWRPSALAAANSINLFSTAANTSENPVGLDATGSGVDLVLNTPAIYGAGSGDAATIAAAKITWNGISGAAPPAIAPGGAGTGSGTFNLVADEIDFGRFVSLDTDNCEPRDLRLQ